MTNRLLKIFKKPISIYKPKIYLPTESSGAYPALIISSINRFKSILPFIIILIKLLNDGSLFPFSKSMY